MRQLAPARDYGWVALGLASIGVVVAFALIEPSQRNTRLAVLTLAPAAYLLWATADIRRRANEPDGYDLLRRANAVVRSMAETEDRRTLAALVAQARAIQHHAEELRRYDWDGPEVNRSRVEEAAELAHQADLLGLSYLEEATEVLDLTTPIEVETLAELETS